MFEQILFEKGKDDGWGMGQRLGTECLAIHIQQIKPGKLKTPFYKAKRF